MTALLAVPAPTDRDDDHIVDAATRREFLAALAALGVLAACGDDDDGSADAPATRTFVDVTGAEVQVPDVARRIVATNDQNAGAQLLSLGAPVVGIASREGVIDPSITAYFDVDDITLVGEHFEPNVEAIAALKPDLIVHEGYEGAISMDAAVLAQLQGIAPVVGIDAFRPIEEVMADHAALLGGNALAVLDQQAAEFNDRLEELRAVLGDRWKEVLGALFVTNGDALEAWAPTTLGASDILGRVGVTWVPLMMKAAEPENGGYISDVSIERIPEFSADLLLVDVAFGGASIMDQPLFKALPAAVAGQVVELDTSISDSHYQGFIRLTSLLTEKIASMNIRTDLV